MRIPVGILFSYLTFLTFNGSAWAAASTEICYTNFAKTTGLVVSTTFTRTKTRTRTDTTTVVTFVTTAPSPSTSTVNSTSTITETFTNSTVTDTLTANVTITNTYNTTTTVFTTTATFTSATTSVSDGTTTVPTPAGWNPVLSSLPTMTADANPAVLRMRQDDASMGDGANLSGASMSGASMSSSTPEYPSGITCRLIVKKVVKTTNTVSSVSTTAASQVIFTVTNPINVTTTMTVAPPDVTNTVNNTIIVNSTSTYTYNTATTTSTTTVSTILNPVATEYAICQNPANYATNISGNYVYKVLSNARSGTSFPRGMASSPKACCTYCEAISGCTGSFYSPDATSDRCYYIIADNGVCSTAGQYSFTAYANDSSLTSGFELSNGKCGQFDMLGD